MHITVIEINLTVSAIDIKPLGNFMNISIKSILEKISLISTKNHGATNTAISSKVVERCGLIPTGKAISNTANGQCTVNTYLIDISLPNNVNINRVQATEFTAVEGADLLIGMDIMSLGDLAISNHEGKTYFSFRIPSIAHTDYVKQLNSMNPIHVKKIGRNDPCPCGSGKKYKQCCGKGK